MKRYLNSKRPQGVAVGLLVACALGGCSLGGEDKEPPRPRGPVVAVVVGADGQRRTSVQADGSIDQAAPDGDGGWFVSGQFRNIGGYDRGYLAHIEADGSVDPDWDPVLDRNETTVTVSAHLVAGGGRVYMAGDFGSVDGEKRGGAAAVDAESGKLDGDWAPDVGIVADAIALTPSHVIVATGTHVDAYDPESGQADAGFRSSAGPDDVEDAGVRTLVVSGPRLYVGGRFRRVNGTDGRRGLARVDAVTGQLDEAWRPPAIGPVSDLSVTPEAVYAVGDFTRVGDVPARGGLAALDPESGELTPFRAPPPGRSADGYAGLYNAVAVAGGRVLAGGDFGAAPTHSFAMLDPHTGAVLPSWHPARRRALVSWIVVSGPNALVVGNKLGG